MRTRVRNPHRHVPLFVAYLVLLFVCELMWRMAILGPLDFQQFRGAISPIVFAAFFLFFSLPCFCQHVGWCAAYGAFLGAASLGTPIVFDSFDGSFFALFRPTTLLGFLTVCALGAAAGGLVGVLWLCIVRLVFGKIAIQDGTLCPTCSYCISYLPASVCPECGNEFDFASMSKFAVLNHSDPKVRKRLHRNTILAVVAMVALLFAAHWFRFTPPLYALFDGRYWRYVLAGSEAERLKLRQLVSTVPEERGREFEIDEAEVRSIMGPPDLVFNLENKMDYLYFDLRGSRKGEIYLKFVDGAFTGVGSNVSGVNDLSKWSRYPNSK